MIWLVSILALFWSVTAHAETANLTWNPNTEPDLAGYRIYRAIPCGGMATFVLQIPGVGYSDQTIPSGTQTVGYELSAIDTSGNESARTAQACKAFAIVYYKTVTDAQGVTWGLVGSGPEYRVYRQGADLQPGDPGNIASDVRVRNGVAEFQGTHGDTSWWMYSDATGWQQVNEDVTPPAVPAGLEVQ